MILCQLRPASTRRTARQRLLPALERTPVRMVQGTPTGPVRLGLSCGGYHVHPQSRARIFLAGTVTRAASPLCPTTSGMRL